LNVSGVTPGGPLPPEGQRGLDAIKAADGFEHIYTMGTGDGQGLTVLVFRDKASLEAVAAQRARDEAQMATLGVNITPAQFYDTFAEL
jgi:hypothetical protein